MTNARQRLGSYAEDLACAELLKRGHSIMARNYRTEHGELDVVTTQNGCVVFVEVRAKSSATFGEPAESVDIGKQRRLAWMATDYVARHRLENAPCRFDVVAVEADTDPPRIVVFEDAFRPGW